MAYTPRAMAATTIKKGGDSAKYFFICAPMARFSSLS
jgi:hypothetical protein